MVWYTNLSLATQRATTNVDPCEAREWCIQMQVWHKLPLKFITFGIPYF